MNSNQDLMKHTMMDTVHTATGNLKVLTIFSLEVLKSQLNQPSPLSKLPSQLRELPSTVHTAVIPTSTNVSLKNSTDASKIEENDGVENINNAEHSDPSRKGLTTEGQEAENVEKSFPDKIGKGTQSKEVGSPPPFSPKRRSKAFTEYKWLKMAEKNENNSDQTEEETEKDFNSENEFHDFTSDRSEEDILVSLLGQ